MALGALVLAAAVVAAVVSLRSDANPASAGATTSVSPTASSGEDAEPGSDESDPSEGDQSDLEASDKPTKGDSGEADPTDGGADPGEDTADPEARETLEPAPFGAEATPEPGVTVTVTSVEKVTGEANVPGEVGGPALRFDVELTNGTGKVLDMRTVVVNAYYGPDRTPTTPLLKPGAVPFEPELKPDGSARGVFVFGVPPKFQSEVELEFDLVVHAPVVVFTGS
jgi:hypothetical protein